MQHNVQIFSSKLNEGHTFATEGKIGQFKKLLYQSSINKQKKDEIHKKNKQCNS